MKFKVRKIYLQSLIQKLMELYNDGVDYVDLSGHTSSSNRDLLEIEESEYSPHQIDLNGDLSDYI